MQLEKLIELLSTEEHFEKLEQYIEAAYHCCK